MSQRWRIDSRDSLNFFVEFAMKKIGKGEPLTVEFMAQPSPKTAAQVRYMHSMCNALADYKHCAGEEAKADAKAAFGIVEVSSSHLDGSRRLRLKSFSDYSKIEAQTFCTQMEAHLDENCIPYTKAILSELQEQVHS